MKKTILTAVAMMMAAASASAAQASTLNCSTEPTATGAQYGIAIETNGDGTANVHVTLSGGMAHFIMIVGDFKAEILHRGPEAAEFKSGERDFDLTVVYQRLAGERNYSGSVVMDGLGGLRINESVECR